jgi:hypothetical protein
MKFFDAPFSSPGNVMHSTDDSWEDIDMTAYLGADAGNVAGVYGMVQFVGTPIDFGTRKNGNTTDTDKGRGSNNSGIMFAAGLDSNDIFEAYSSDASKTAVYPWGYWRGDGEAEFLDTFQDVTPGTGAVWTNTPMGSYFTGTVQVVFLLFVNTGGELRKWGCQDVNGPDRFGYAPETFGYEVGVARCTSEACEIYINSTTNTTVHLIGGITSGFTKFDDTFDITNTDGPYEDIDMSGDASVGDKAFIYHYHDGTGEDLDLATKCMIRKDGQSWDQYGLWHGRRAVPRIGGMNSSSRIAEVKAEDAAVDLYIFGSFGDGVAGPDGQVVTTYLNDIA